MTGPDGPASSTDSPPRDGIGDPDGLRRLWTPHRMAYIARDEAGDESSDDSPEDSPDVSRGRPGDARACPFCRIPTLPDEDGLVVARGERVYAVLNLYPYNAGHLMVVPFRHVGDYTDADTDEVTEIGRLTQHAMRVIRQVSAPQGFNIGINVGGAAGAGIAAHLHQHLVPRWDGDANFMPVIGHTKVLPQLLLRTRELLASAW
jgi:ATP adenylyltransferase